MKYRRSGSCGPAPTSRTSRLPTSLGEASLGLGLGRRLKRPFRPQTNGKAERLTPTLLAEWAYDGTCYRSDRRSRALSHNLSFYKTERRRSAL
jgi:hypothetical protein